MFTLNRGSGRGLDVLKNMAENMIESGYIAIAAGDTFSSSGPISPRNLRVRWQPLYDQTVHDQNWGVALIQLVLKHPLVVQSNATPSS